MCGTCSLHAVAWHVVTLHGCDGHHEMSDLVQVVSGFTVVPSALSQCGSTSDWMGPLSGLNGKIRVHLLQCRRNLVPGRFSVEEMVTWPPNSD
jgi:hypothetical protein